MSLEVEMGDEAGDVILAQEGAEEGAPRMPGSEGCSSLGLSLLMPVSPCPVSALTWEVSTKILQEGTGVLFAEPLAPRQENRLRGFLWIEFQGREGKKVGFAWKIGELGKVDQDG